MTTLFQQTQTPQAATPQIVALQARELELREEVAKLQAQHNVLEAQARSSEGYIRIPAQQQLMQVDLQLAAGQADLASVQARIVAAGGRTTTETPPPRQTTSAPPPGPRAFLDRIDPDAITAVFVLTTLAFIVPLSVAITRRLWRRPARETNSPALDAIASRLERVEQAVDAVAIEMERVAESQRFVARVLVERPSAPAPVVAEADNASALGEAKPFLALGAGPLEPIPVVQRPAVKQSVTPH
ncbi:MAG TPA: hypothetical protein VIP11_23990 [Gemmatimonadaceae bacterium]